MTRYEIAYSDNAYKPNMQQSPRGEWVRVADLEAALDRLKPEPPCPCEPMTWRECTCGAYREGRITMAQIDCYADVREVLDEIRRLLGV